LLLEKLSKYCLLKFKRSNLCTIKSKCHSSLLSHVWWLLPCGRQLRLRTALFWVIMLQAVVISYWQVVLTLADGTARLSQNVGKKLPLLTA